MFRSTVSIKSLISCCSGSAGRLDTSQAGVVFVGDDRRSTAAAAALQGREREGGRCSGEVFRK